MIDASKELKQWLCENITILENSHISYELRLPSKEDDINKSALVLDAAPLLSSLTIWGSGMTEFIVLNGDNGEDVISIDHECKTPAEVISFLDSSLKKIIDLQ